MNSRLLLRVTAPAVAIGLVLFATCLASIRYISQLQSNLATILADDVTSLQAAQELEIRVRQLRFHSMLYLMDPRAKRLDPIEDDHQRFEKSLEVARQACKTEQELACVQAIEVGYHKYHQEQDQLRADVARTRHISDFPKIVDSHPIRLVINPCKDLLRVTKEKLEETAAESRRVSREAHLAMLILGLAGPIGGLIMGYGVARGLRQSIARLSVRVQDMAQRLNQKVASVSVAADGDIRDLDRQMGYVIAKIEDVAERMQQQQRDMMRAEQLSTMGQLAAGVAHEVRNPLTGIKLLVEAALRSRNPRPLGTEDVRMIHREVARLEQTVQGFLDFARLPAAERAPCDLRDVVAQARELVRIRARQQNVDFVVHDPGQAVVAAVDRGQFGTVLVNLFFNALDAMPRGGRLDVTLAAHDGSIRLEVSDSGGGIVPQVAGRLFHPFTTTKPNGTGLGLSVSMRILEEHGGSITAGNRPEGGARFVITLPVREGCHADAAAD